MPAIHTRAKARQVFINPSLQVNVGLWTLFAGATFFLALRIWIKISRRHGLWWDDRILLISWVILAVNNGLISYEYASGFVTPKWDNRMHILINITSCGTLIGQALTKTAFAVTLLKLTERWMKWLIWFCIGSMNTYMLLKVLFQWAKLCDKPTQNESYHFGLCLDSTFRNDFKIGGQIYNVVMDFVLASVPWIITWNLTMPRMEKIGLCITMSLGMLVAIETAVRISWKDEGNSKDQFYFVRLAHSAIWYSSEIVGTIIVQCIPVLRPLIRDIHTSLMSKRLPSSADSPAARTRPLTQYTPSTSNTTQIYSDAEELHSMAKCEPSYAWDSQQIYVNRVFKLSTNEPDSQKSNDSPA